MNTVLTIISFVLIMTVVVVIHEAGHALVARACGARVTEFFIGLPGPGISRTSKRGLRYGVTVVLLGGYTKIAGMADVDETKLGYVLADVNARGRVSASGVAKRLDMTCDEARVALEALVDWGSIQKVVPGESDIVPYDGSGDVAFETVARDVDGRTVRDRGFRAGSGGTNAGEPCFLNETAGVVFEKERKNTYAGLGYVKRVAILVAGIACNLALAFAILVGYLCIQGIPYVPNTIASVVEGSVADEAGVRPGDQIVSLGQRFVTGYEDLPQAVAEAQGAGPMRLVFERDNTLVETDVEMDRGEPLGVAYAYDQYRFGLGEAARSAVLVIGQTGAFVAQLLVPQQAAEVVQSSSGIVGIAAVTSEAVDDGMWTVVLLAGLISLSLGWMNLLPILPLDGGHVVIETIQRVIGRKVSTRVKTAYALLGIACILTLFIVVTTQDISRIFG